MYKVGTYVQWLANVCQTRFANVIVGGAVKGVDRPPALVVRTATTRRRSSQISPGQGFFVVVVVLLLIILTTIVQNFNTHTHTKK